MMPFGTDNETANSPSRFFEEDEKIKGMIETDFEIEGQLAQGQTENVLDSVLPQSGSSAVPVSHTETPARAADRSQRYASPAQS